MNTENEHERGNNRRWVMMRIMRGRNERTTNGGEKQIGYSNSAKRTNIKIEKSTNKNNRFTFKRMKHGNIIVRCMCDPNSFFVISSVSRSYMYIIYRLIVEKMNKTKETRFMIFSQLNTAVQKTNAHTRTTGRNTPERENERKNKQMFN